MTAGSRAYSPVDISSTTFWATTAIQREQSFARLRAQEPVSWQPPADDAVMRMTSDVANRFWQGKVNLPVAMARGQVKVEGRIGSLLKLVPSTKELFPAYVALLERDGRHDLLADD